MSYQIEVPDDILADKDTTLYVEFTVHEGEAPTRDYPGSPDYAEWLRIKTGNGKDFDLTGQQEKAFTEWFDDVALDHAADAQEGARDAAVDAKYDAIRNGE